MIRDETYRRADLPRELEVQVLDFMRMEWGKALFNGEDRYRDLLWEDPDAVHFVRAAGRLLVSHAQVLKIEARGRDDEVFHIAGIASVLTYPPFRHEGHASVVMRRVAEHIVGTGAGVGLLFTDDEIEPFYERLGWTKVDRDRVHVQGQPPEDTVMVLGDPIVLPALVQLQSQW